MTGTQDIDFNDLFEQVFAERNAGRIFQDNCPAGEIAESFYTLEVTKDGLDELLSSGWRHFARHFYRYSAARHKGKLQKVIPLRIRLKDFSLSPSKRRILTRNADLTVEFCALEITPEIEALFHRHKSRYSFAVPDSIYLFLSRDSVSSPTDCRQLLVRKDGQLLAASFFDVGNNSVSAIYGCFDPDEKRRSLGIFTMLKVIEFAASDGMTFYYHGYSYRGKSFYDYKKRFSGLEAFDWKGRWKRFATESTEVTEK